MLHLYAIFHLNLMYSSVEEHLRPTVVRDCYWPLLNLIERLEPPLGIEAPGITLETIHALDPAWTAKLRDLVRDGKCQFIGSGYAQLIGPLVPAEVNAANQLLGQQVYRDLVGSVPTLAVINEQAYSSGLIEHYQKAGYQAIVMEWENPARFHPQWNSQWRYYPQIACGQQGQEIPLIWNMSIAFQRFQRYVHRQIDLDEYIAYLASHIDVQDRAFPIYSSDVEVFDFRPGRYHTEAPPAAQSEWRRIGVLFESLLARTDMTFVSPNQVLDMFHAPNSGNRIQLESPEEPVPVKKQAKYNLSRWAVTGRDDLAINSACWRLYDRIKGTHESSVGAWKELCYLWSSDFRTHITKKRWGNYYRRLPRASKLAVETESTSRETTPPARMRMSSATMAVQRGRILEVKMDAVQIFLDCQRGLAIESLWFKDCSDLPVIRRLPQGYYDDIEFGADFFSGHTIHEVPGRSRLTDLVAVLPTVTEFHSGASSYVEIEAEIPTDLGPIIKTIHVYKDQSRIDFRYRFHWSNQFAASIRTGNLTLNPDAFDQEGLFFRCANGGSEPETFLVSGHDVSHGQAATPLVSASTGLGDTQGRIELGDSRIAIAVETDHSLSVALPMISFRAVGKNYFFRLAFSLGEVDETRVLSERVKEPSLLEFKLSIRPVGG